MDVRYRARCSDLLGLVWCCGYLGVICEKVEELLLYYLMLRRCSFVGGRGSMVRVLEMNRCSRDHAWECHLCTLGPDGEACI